MEKYYETKIGRIVEKNFDARMTNAVIAYIVDKGWDNVKDITDEQISEIKDQGIMGADFSQALVRTAREICQTCSMWDDFMPYIRCHIGINGCQTQEVKFDKEDFSEDEWDNFTYQLDIDDDTDRIEGFMIITDEIVYEED